MTTHHETLSRAGSQEGTAKTRDSESSGARVTFRYRSGSSIYQRFFENALDRCVHDGRIALTVFGVTSIVGRGQGPVDAVVRIHNPDFFRKVVCNGNLGLGEAYMAGDFDVDGERLPELLTLLLKSGVDKHLKGDLRFALRYAWIRLVNLLQSKRTNVQRHYDIGEELFDTFLRDPYQVYSCGYAHSSNDDAATLQQSKLDRICRKLMLEPGQRLLDIGCGKGGLLIHAAMEYGVSGVGITNSHSHYRCASEKVREQKLEQRVEIILGDFSEVQGVYDRVASVGMLEHLPARQLAFYFNKIKKLLRPQGWALVHAIGLNASKNEHDPFIQKYIFPGSDTPRLSTIARSIESNDLAIIDVENMVRHYAVTCRRWLEGFRANREHLDPVRYDAQFKRMWEYYLCCGVAAALAGNLSVYQVLFTSDYHAAYPFQRV